MHNTLRRLTWALATLSVVAAARPGHSQSADALIDKLVDKGILTVKEAKDLREEADKGFTQSYQVKSGLPDWVTTLRIGGDLRGRYDGVFVPDADPAQPASSSANFVDRHRFRYRLRAGVVATMKDQLEVGFRLSSAEPKGTAGMGDPISGNATFNNNGAKKFVFIDQAYGKWMPLHTADFSLATTVGKMENPFVLSEMIFDPDYTPEGAAINAVYNLTDKHAVKLNGAGFMLHEFSVSSHDPFMAGAQLRWDAAWTPKIQTSLGAALLSVVNAKSELGDGRTGLTTANVPDVNEGNSRIVVPTAPGATTTTTALANTFTTFVADAGVTYSLETFPMYPGAFPIKVGGEYAENLLADSRNKAYGLGVTFGKSGKKGTWDLSYRWKELQGDFWYEEFVDSDFGGFYQSPAGAGAAIGQTAFGYGPGTNLRGHVIKAQYSPYDSFTLAATVYLVDVIDTVGGPATAPVSARADSSVTRVQLDAIWKF